MAQRICPYCSQIENEYTYFCTKCGARTIEYGDVVNAHSDHSHKQSAENVTAAAEQERHEASKAVKAEEVNEEEPPVIIIEDKEDIRNGTRNNKGLIIGLSVAVGVLFAAVIALALPKGRNGNTGAEENAYHEENAAEMDVAEAGVAQENVAGEYSDNSERDILHNGKQNGDETSADDELVSQLGNSGDNAEPFLDEGINSYKLIVADVTWTEAFNDCLNRGGYLARITSEEEYRAILRQIHKEGKDNIKFWIGGARKSGDEYHWVYEDGSLSGDIINKDDRYTGFWFEGEPSLYDEMTQSSEDRMNMFYMKSTETWGWNDVPDDILEVAGFYAGTIGYICEYE